MRIPAKTTAYAAGLLLAVTGLAGCGGDSGSKTSSASSQGTAGADAPTSAPKSDFCDGFGSFVANTANLDTTGDTKSAIKTAKSEVAKLQKTGTVNDISADQRAGFEVFIDTIESIPDDASASDLKSYGSDLSTAKQTELKDFITYVSTECPDAFGTGTADSGSASPSTIPSTSASTN